MARASNSKENTQLKKLRKAVEILWMIKIREGILERYGTLNPTLNQLTPATRARVQGYDERGKYVSAKIPYFTCVCPSVVDEKATAELHDENFGMGYVVSKDAVIKRRPKDNEHKTDCPLRLVSV